MMPTLHALVWVEIAAAVVGGGILILLLIGLVFMGTARGTRRPMGLFWNRIEARQWGARSFVDVDQLDPQRALTIQAILQRGWSPELAKKVLGRPDYAVLDPQRKQEPLRLYDRARVEKAEKGKKFRTYRAHVANEEARTEARIRKWLVLRQLDTGEAAPVRHEG